jgi:hypothetical protein
MHHMKMWRRRRKRKEERQQLENRIFPTEIRTHEQAKQVFVLDLWKKAQ